MSEIRRRRPRADGARNKAAVLDAAVDLLGRSPAASMDEIAVAAGVSRQTVYGHFSSRDALVDAVVDLMTSRVTAAIAGADLDTLPPTDALRRWVRVCWDLMERYPALVNASVPAAADPADDRERHEPIMGPLGALIARGQRAGQFDTAHPTDWYVAAVIALGHAAGIEVGAGRMAMARAGAAFEAGVMRICAAPDPSAPRLTG